MQLVSRLPGFRIFASNEDTKLKLRKWVAPKFWESIPVTYTCVDPVGVKAVEDEGVDKKALRERFGIPTDKFVVLTVGQFIDRKGRWTLMEAARTATDIDGNMVFIWVTPTLPEGVDANRFESFGMGEKFRLIRSADLGGARLDVLRFFKVADCFALPSFVEGLPIAILEAMALGLPTISTNVFAIPEAVKHEETGLLVEAGDSDELCRSILRIKNDSALSRSLALAGRNFVLENFDERVASRIALDAFEGCFKDR
jgi:glycosyltransferase involved in cell wall biosynthesis